jgi:hypothetical protein
MIHEFRRKNLLTVTLDLQISLYTYIQPLLLPVLGAFLLHFH